MRRSHGTLDDQAFNVLPVLLQQRNQEVDGHVDVRVLDNISETTSPRPLSGTNTYKFLLGETNVANSNSETQHLLELEFHGARKFGHLYHCNASPLANLDGTFSSSLSWCVTNEGNLPALFRPGPRSLGTWRIIASEAINASYFLATTITSATQAESGANRASSQFSCSASPSEELRVPWKGCRAFPLRHNVVGLQEDTR